MKLSQDAPIIKADVRYDTSFTEGNQHENNCVGGYTKYAFVELGGMFDTQRQRTYLLMHAETGPREPTLAWP